MYQGEESIDELLEMDISKIYLDIVIKYTKNGKLSGILVKLIKYVGDRLKGGIRILIYKVVGKEWEISHISSIYEKGDRRDSINDKVTS